MKYHIFSINDDRYNMRQTIVDRVDLERARIRCFNAYEQNIAGFLKSRGMHFDRWTPKIGEAGIWISNILAWEWCVENDESLICFEDDAIPLWDFSLRLGVLTEELKDTNWDICSLWVPNNQLQDYWYYVTFNEIGDPVHSSPPAGWKGREDSIYNLTGKSAAARIYQGYGGVAFMYTPAGAYKLLNYLRVRGIFTPVDCGLCQLSHLDILSGYAPRPEFRLVDYDWLVPTTIHKSSLIDHKDRIMEKL